MVDQKNKIKLGLIKGRHPMSVDDYVIKERIPKGMLSSKDLFSLRAFIEGAVDRVIYDDYPGVSEVDLYLTGLSRVQHLVIDAFLRKGIMLNLYDYDRGSQEYFMIKSLKDKVDKTMYYVEGKIVEENTYNEEDLKEAVLQFQRKLEGFYHSLLGTEFEEEFCKLLVDYKKIFGDFRGNRK